MPCSVSGFELDTQASLPVVQFRPFGGVFWLIDLALHPQIEQGCELCLYLIVLPAKLSTILAVVVLSGVGTCADHVDKPLPRFFIELDRCECRQKLAINFRFCQSNLWVSCGRVTGAAVIAVGPLRAIR